MLKLKEKKYPKMIPMGPSMGHGGHPGQHAGHGGPPQNAPAGPNSLSTSNQSNKSTVVVCFLEGNRLWA